LAWVGVALRCALPFSNLLLPVVAVCCFWSVRERNCRRRRREPKERKNARERKQGKYYTVSDYGDCIGLQHQ
jgi:hypothetical protein